MMINFNASAMLISVVAAMHLLPAVIQAPFTGTLVDKLPFKSLMVFLLIIEIIMTLLFLTVSSIDDIWMLLVFIFIRMGAASFYFNAEMTLLPNLVKGEKLQIANEIHSILWSLTYTAGMAVSGFVVYSLGSTTAFVIDAILFVVALVLLLPLKLPDGVISNGEKIIDMMKDGIIYIKEHKEVIHIILLHAAVGLTAFDALVTLLADNEYAELIAAPLAIGSINAVRAFALMIGPMFLGQYVNRDNFGYIYLFQGLAIIVWAMVQDNYWLAFIGVFVTGFFTSTIWSYTYSMLQNSVEPKFLGRVIAYNDMVFMLSNVLTSLLIGTMASLNFSHSIITATLGVAFIFVSVYYFAIKHKV